jgi:hypothetical protein
LAKCRLITRETAVDVIINYSYIRPLSLSRLHSVNYRVINKGGEVGLLCRPEIQHENNIFQKFKLGKRRYFGFKMGLQGLSYRNVNGADGHDETYWLHVAQKTRIEPMSHYFSGSLCHTIRLLHSICLSLVHI